MLGPPDARVIPVGCLVRRLADFTGLNQAAVLSTVVDHAGRVYRAREEDKAPIVELWSILRAGSSRLKCVIAA